MKIALAKTEAQEENIVIQLSQVVAWLLVTHICSVYKLDEFVLLLLIL